MGDTLRDKFNLKKGMLLCLLFAAGEQVLLFHLLGVGISIALCTIIKFPNYHKKQIHRKCKQQIVVVSKQSVYEQSKLL